MKIIFCILLVLSGCRCSKPEYRYTNETHDYDKYLVMFNSDLNAVNEPILDFSRLSIVVSEDLTAGYARSVNGFNDGSDKVIEVSGFFKNMPDWLQRLVIYHEIGHTYCNLNHTQSGIMYGGDLLFKYNSQIDFKSLVKQMLEGIK